MKHISIFGAGVRGRELYRILYRYRYEVECFVDNDVAKQGTWIYGIPVLSLNEYMLMKNSELIISIYDSEKVEDQLKQINMKYYIFQDGEKSFFSQNFVKEYLDSVLLQDYLILKYDRESLFKEHEKNWYRKDFFDEFNRNIVRKMITTKENILNSEIYEVIYPDEYFQNRSDMHLVANLIEMFCKTGDKVIDIGAGHGFLLDELKKQNKYELIACEGSPQRCKYLRQKNYRVIENNVENMNDVLDESLDAIICMETLEHVIDVQKSVHEINRILKKFVIVYSLL